MYVHHTHTCVFSFVLTHLLLSTISIFITRLMVDASLSAVAACTTTAAAVLKMTLNKREILSCCFRLQLFPTSSRCFSSK